MNSRWMNSDLSKVIIVKIKQILKILRRFPTTHFFSTKSKEQ